MGASDAQPSVRVTFTDFIPDPVDDDCLRRAVTVTADQLTFQEEHVTLWRAGTELERYPLRVVQSISLGHEATGNERQPGPIAVRGRHPNAYMPWTGADEERLLKLYREGTRDLVQLGSELGRQPSAVRSRLGKLGLGRDANVAGTGRLRRP